MELNQVLEARRSIRHYQDQPVDLTLIGQMIEAAILSPSWKNSQTARYHVVSSPEMLKKIKTTVCRISIRKTVRTLRFSSSAPL